MKQLSRWLFALLPTLAFAGAPMIELVDLPKPRTDGSLSVEKAFAQRRTVREFAPTPMSLAEASQLLWAAQGITDAAGRRTAPSAGALYPLTVHFVAGDVAGLPPGIYRYEPQAHRLQREAAGDRRGELARAALGQGWMSQAPAILAFGAIDARTTGKYGRRGIGYIHIEVGHAAQNVLLQAQALGLGAGEVGAFDDDAVAALLGMGRGERPIYLVPVGKRRE